MEILVLMFIEGASKLDLDEDWSLERWTLHLLYEVTPLEGSSVSPYTIAGFSTSHRYWIFPTFEVLRAIKSLPSHVQSTNGDATTYKPSPLELAPGPAEGEEEGRKLFKDQLNPLEAPSRERISQFLILPPYQGQSLGTKLYETIFQHYHKMPNIYEIPVEDPSEAFDAMRDFSDIKYLRSVPAFRDLQLASSVPTELLRKDSPIPRDLILGNGADLTALRHETKIVPRQFNRMVELHVFSKIPALHRNRTRLTRKDKSTNENDRKYYFWRLALKDRIYRQNSAELDEVRKEDPEQAVEVLENAVDNQQQEYVERLEAIQKHESITSTSDTGSALPRHIKRKRVIVEEEDDWEDVDDESVSSKKAKN
jgi:histone acetyltransferase 1